MAPILPHSRSVLADVPAAPSRAAAPPAPAFARGCFANPRRQVLELIAQGRNNQAIASELTISLKTARTHVSNIFNKLQVTDRAAAIVKARETGLGIRPSP